MVTSILSLQGSGAQTVGSHPSDQQRALMTFSSKLRLSRDVAVVKQRQTLFGSAGNGSILQTSITMRLNPRSVKWSQPKRITKKDTRRGSTYFHFNNAAGQNNDILTLSFSGNTGNIDLRGSVPSPTGTPPNATDAQAKLVAWHNLYLMTKEPMLLATGEDNVFHILYQSALFQSPVTFNGFFQKVMEFEESASKPNSRDYSFDFTVTSTSPDLDTYLGVLGTIIGTPNPVVNPAVARPAPTRSFLGTPDIEFIQNSPPPLPTKASGGQLG